MTLESKQQTCSRSRAYICVIAIDILILINLTNVSLHQQIKKILHMNKKNNPPFLRMMMMMIKELNNAYKFEYKFVVQ